MAHSWGDRFRALVRQPLKHCAFGGHPIAAPSLRGGTFATSRPVPTVRRGSGCFVLFIRLQALRRSVQVDLSGGPEQLNGCVITNREGNLQPPKTRQHLNSATDPSATEKDTRVRDRSNQSSAEHAVLHTPPFSSRKSSNITHSPKIGTVLTHNVTSLDIPSNVSIVRLHGYRARVSKTGTRYATPTNYLYVSIS
jgi:hypothetical protein